MHKPTATPSNRTASFTLKSGVALYGGFWGDETRRDQRKPYAHLTVLSGDIDNNDTVDSNGMTVTINGNNSYNVVRGQGVDNTAVLDGFIITGGQANDPLFAYDEGGGIRLINSHPRLVDLIFFNNTANSGGGAYLENSSPTLERVRFRRNSASSGGGMLCRGIGSGESRPVLREVIFEENTASGVVGGGGLSASACHPQLDTVTFFSNLATNGPGGGMDALRSNPRLVNVRFLDNSASGSGGGAHYDNNSGGELDTVTFQGNRARDGGGMAVLSGRPTLRNVTFVGNQATDEGGGMYVDHTGGPNLQWVVFRENRAGYRGGGMYTYIRNLTSPPAAHPELVYVIFERNSAGGWGGGMANEADSLASSGSSPTLTNVLFDSNTAGSGAGGGGMFNANRSSPTLQNVTFAGNQGFFGGAIANSDNSNPILRNVLVWGNESRLGGSAKSIDNNSSTPRIAYSNLEGCLTQSGTTWVLYSHCGSDGGNNRGGDPLFVNPATRNWRLQAGSPMIDAGTNAAVPVWLAVDLDQRQRIEDGDGNGIAVVDIGAYEFHHLPYVASITRLDPSPTNAGSVRFQIDFSEAVTNVDAGDFTLTHTGSLAGLSIASVSGSGARYTVTVNVTSGSGTLRLDLPASASIFDTSGNGLTGLPYTAGEVYQIDRTHWLYLPLVLRP
ncbi:MAG: hypothetical protein NZ840_08725 [Anaerolineales bacterium]|nr:hypothetical protein [Anaerolineales bacterium]MDW8162124.1 choice-of-anchor Q domain-containing protein [Anaerolineales bacterium]